MVDQVNTIFNLPRNKIDTIPNGVNIQNYGKTPPQAFRNRFATQDEKVVLYVGRLVYEKGVSILLDAVHQILRRVNAKFVIVGEGYMKEKLMAQASQLGISHKVFFTGFLDGAMVKRLYRVADVFVAPSLYEPFGIVALEAMASQAPIVVSDVGGLREIVEHDRTGVTVHPNNSGSLAWGILRVLENKVYSRRISRNGYNKITTEYNWNTIAEQTKKVYLRILSEYEKGDWKAS
jgi:glycosyltransferase involved in cell wall biosynthesis